MKYLACLLFLALLPLARGEDVLFLSSGEKRSGRLVGIEGGQLRLQVPLPGPAGAAPVFASVSVNRSDITEIEFSPDRARDALLRNPSSSAIPLLETEWKKWLPWLDMPRSPTADVGVTLADLLLRGGDPAQAQKALEICQQVEAGAWNSEDRMNARQGRLRAMVATGRAKDAVQEAIELAAITESPAVLIEAKYILAEADDAALRKLVADNPRWEEDIFVRPEHARLYHGALDLYLYPYLFYGSEIEPAARGLWGAAKVFDFVGEKSLARECARDIEAIYPGTKYAALAKDYLASLPQEIRDEDPEKQAREDNAAPPEDAKTQKSQKKSSQNPKNEKPS